MVFLSQLMPARGNRADEEALVKLFHHPDQDVPENFDARENWPQCASISTIVKQSDCYCSWAISVATMLTDRLCIGSNGSREFKFSIEDILTCCHECFTSHPYEDGEPTPFYALKYWLKEGVVSGSEKGCKPLKLSSGEIDITNGCSKSCTNSQYRTGYKNDKVFGKVIWRMTKPWNIKQVQIEIMTKGPVATTVAETKHFLKMNTSGVYQRPEGSQEEIEHYSVVKIIGWGSEQGVPYWLAANVHGKKWGKLGGFFKIIRGTNLNGFENELYTGDFHQSSFSASASIFQASLKLILFIIFLFCLIFTHTQHNISI